MSDERYIVGTFKGDHAVIDTSYRIGEVVALCGTERHVETVASALNDAEVLRQLVADLLGPDPCQYDHHGLCQAHHLHERPCPHERGKALGIEPA